MHTTASTRRAARKAFPRSVVILALCGALARPGAAQQEARVRAAIQAVEGLLDEVPDRGAALFFLARGYAQLGERRRALALLEECVALRQGFDPSGAPQLQPLRADPGFRRLADRARRDNPAVHRARIAFTVQQADLFPEGLAADPARHVFYLGSMRLRKIVRIDGRGRVSDFVPAGLYDLMPVGGVHVDPADHGVWAATDPGPANRSELVRFDQHGKLLERHPAPGPGPHDLNDLVLRGTAEIYATDTLANQVYRLDRATGAFTPMAFPRRLFYPNGITLSDDGSRLYVADLLGVIRVDLGSGAAREVAPGRGSTLSGIDGLYWHRGALVGVQYGTGSSRVARWRLSSDGLRVLSTDVLERGTALVSFPTTGAIVGDDFYFIANTGIGNLDGGAIVDPGKLEPIHIAVVRLK